MFSKLTIAAAVVLTFNAAAADLRGFVTDGPAGLLVFQTCQGTKLSDKLVRLSDKTPESALRNGVGEVRQVMRDGRERPLYVEFVGEFGGPGVVARNFQRAIGHVEDCSALPKDIPAGTRLLVVGNDLGVRFAVTTEGARLQRPGAKPIRFPTSAFAGPIRSSASRVYDAWSAQDGGTVRLEINEEVCKHEGTETAYGARALLRYGSSTYEGCAARF